MMKLENIFLKILKNRSPSKQIKRVIADETSLFDEYQHFQINDVEVLVVMEELLLNSYEHGRKQKIEIFMGKIKDEFIFIIRDEGEGIHNTVPKNPKLVDIKNKSSSAIARIACEEGISGTGIVGRGLGLHLLSQLCTKKNGDILIACNAEVLVQSGDQFLQKKQFENIIGTFVCFKIRV